MRAALPPDLELTDGLVALRRWSPGDVDDLTEIWQDPELQRRFGVAPPVTGESIATYVDGVARRWRDGVQVSLAIVVDDTLVGGCDLDHLDGDQPDLGYWLAPSARGRGFATRASTLLLDWAHAALDLDDLSVEIEPDNAASIAVAERLGFTRMSGVETADGTRRLILYARPISP